MKTAAFDIIIDPHTDGYDHIRIHPKAATNLGRCLCHSARTPFTHTQYGQFASMEAYWQWIRTGMQHDHLKAVHGERAIGYGLRYLNVPCTNFRELILGGLKAKVEDHPKIQELLVLSDAPFLQYTDPLGIGDYWVDHAHDWYMEGLESLRESWQTKLDVKQSKYLPFKSCQLLEETFLGALPKDPVTL